MVLLPLIAAWCGKGALKEAKEEDMTETYHTHSTSGTDSTHGPCRACQAERETIESWARTEAPFLLRASLEEKSAEGAKVPLTP